MHDPPAGRLAPAAKSLWRLTATLQAAVVVGAVSIAAPWWAAVAVGVAGVAHAVLTPEARWRRWRYEVRDEEIDLQHGAVVLTRTLVAMARVQHVDTRQGPLERRFGLASVVVHTAAGSQSIPALAIADAGALRDRIGVLTRSDDGV